MDSVLRGGGGGRLVCGIPCSPLFRHLAVNEEGAFYQTVACVMHEGSPELARIQIYDLSRSQLSPP